MGLYFLWLEMICLVQNAPPSSLKYILKELYYAYIYIYFLIWVYMLPLL